MAKWPVGSHGGTYGGNVLACAAAIATIQTMREEKLVKNSAVMGQVLMTGLRQLQEENSEIGDVRGLGLMIATEFTQPNSQPWSERANVVTQAALEHGLMLLTCGTYGQVVRWIPPLIATEPQIHEALQIFTQALAETQSS
jgi:4-aminobutyrate aminotransferase